MGATGYVLFWLLVGAVSGAVAMWLIGNVFWFVCVAAAAAIGVFILWPVDTTVE